MSQLACKQLGSLTAAIRSHDFLSRIVDELERLHRVVFHKNANADWNLVRASAEQVLVAEIIGRHRGEIDGIYHALRNLEHAGKSWDAAIAELAAGMHAYYTTPLGLVMRQELFGEQAVFFTTDVYEWTEQLRGRPKVGASKPS